MNNAPIKSSDHHRTGRPTVSANDSTHLRRLLRIINRKSFATLATVSPAGRPHNAGVIYAAADGELWVHTMASSRKAINVAANPHVGVSIPYRRLPVGPPFTIHFQATAGVVALDDPEVRALMAAGELKPITGHGAMDMDGACFLRIRLGSALHSYGPGARTADLIRDPLNNGARTVRLDAEGGPR